MRKLFIIGSKGLLGKELVEIVKQDNSFEMITSDVSDENGIDITNEDSIKSWFEKIKPNIVINCAAYTNVDACETEDGFKVAQKVNGTAPGTLAKYCIKYNADFVHISSDYVFGDDKKEGYKEDYTNFKPLNKYAETKLLGEQEVTKVYTNGTDNWKQVSVNSHAYIIRTSWLFGRGATNFISKIIQYAKEKPFLEVVTDETSSPTYIKDLAERIVYIIKNRPESGIYHVTGFGYCSRYEFAKEILKWAKINTEVKPITWEKFAKNRKTQIAKISYLINTKLPQMRTWQEMVKDYIENEELQFKN